MKKHNNKTHIKKKKSSILIRVIKKNKNSPKESRERERERERESSQFLYEKNMDWMGEMISNLHK